MTTLRFLRTSYCRVASGSSPTSAPGSAGGANAEIAVEVARAKSSATVMSPVASLTFAHAQPSKVVAA